MDTTKGLLSKKRKSTTTPVRVAGLAGGPCLFCQLQQHQATDGNGSNGRDDKDVHMRKHAMQGGKKQHHTPIQDQPLTEGKVISCSPNLRKSSSKTNPACMWSCFIFVVVVVAVVGVVAVVVVAVVVVVVVVILVGIIVIAAVAVVAVVFCRTGQKCTITEPQKLSMNAILGVACSLKTHRVSQ